MNNIIRLLFHLAKNIFMTLPYKTMRFPSIKQFYIKILKISHFNTLWEKSSKFSKQKQKKSFKNVQYFGSSYTVSCFQNHDVFQNLFYEVIPQVDPLYGEKRISVNLEMIVLYQIDLCILLWLNMHLFDLLNVVGPQRVNKKWSYSAYVCPDFNQKSVNKAKK